MSFILALPLIYWVSLGEFLDSSLLFSNGTSHIFVTKKIFFHIFSLIYAIPLKLCLLKQLNVWSKNCARLSVGKSTHLHEAFENIRPSLVSKALLVIGCGCPWTVQVIGPYFSSLYIAPISGPFKIPALKRLFFETKHIVMHDSDACVLRIEQTYL